MRLRTASVLFALTFALVSLRAQAQNEDTDDGARHSLARRVAALEARIDKLEGNITADDLVGTYTIAGIQTRLGGGTNARIGSAALTGTLALNQDGTGSLTINGDGAVVVPLLGVLQPNWMLSPSTLGNGNPGPILNLTWTYANGVITPTLVAFGQGPGINVGPGGRLLVASFPEFNAPASRADVSLLIFYRLR